MATPRVGCRWSSTSGSSAAGSLSRSSPWSPASSSGWIFYDTLIRWLAAPICDVPVSDNVGGGTCGPLVINGLLGPFNLQVKVALVAGVFIASPVWLYQLWAFVTPGLHRNERRWTVGFLVTAIPLFFTGAAVCYWILPRATKLLLGFTPDQVGSIVDFNEFLSIVMRLMLVFGLAFEVPGLHRAAQPGRAAVRPGSWPAGGGSSRSASSSSPPSRRRPATRSP